MKFKDFRSNYLLEITSYLTFNELINFQLVCKNFRELFVAYKDLFQQRCLRFLGLQYSTELLQCKEILESLNEHKSNLISTFMPYYTDGGTYRNDPLYFIDQLLLNTRGYCTKKEKNILVKYAYSKSMNFTYSNDPSEYDIGNGVLYVQEIEKEAEKYSEFCPYIREIVIGFPPLHYTCPADVYMCFSSMKNMQDISFINRFHSCYNSDSACSIGNELGISNRHTVNQEYTIVEFESSQSDIQALFWIKYNYYAERPKDFTVRLNQGRFAKYFYLLLISARHCAGHNNIDMGKMMPFGNRIRIMKGLTDSL